MTACSFPIFIHVHDNIKLDFKSYLFRLLARAGSGAGIAQLVVCWA